MAMGKSNSPTEHDDDDNVHEEANPAGTPVEAFFAASVVFITGVTGFLGKALLEKLLRACPRISTIYVLIRPKKNQSLEKRLQLLSEDPVYDRIKWECPGAFTKVIPILGDVSQPNLGISEEDRLTLTQRVNIVFHSAATVRFDEPLKVAANLNAKGTERMIELCSGIINLVSFIHVSTAYSNADQVDIKETIYSTKIEPEVIIKMCESLDDETLKILEKRLCGKHPNTYTLTKRLAENIIVKKGSGLPIAIVRPSIICAAYREPFPGWVDKVSGITGIMMEIGRGTIRSIVCNGKLVVDVIPVDYVVDTLICSAWYRAMHCSNTIQVYNCVSSTFNPVTWQMFGELTGKHAIESPSKYVLFYPGFTFRTNKLIHKLFVALLHYLPAFIVDLALRFKGGKPVMLEATKRFERAAQTGEFFSTNEWNFQSDNMLQLARTIKATDDSNSFNVDIATVDWDSYVHKYILGIRKYILKDSPDSLTKARKHLSKLYWIQKFIQTFVAFTLMKIIFSVCR